MLLLVINGIIKFAIVLNTIVISNFMLGSNNFPVINFNLCLKAVNILLIVL